MRRSGVKREGKRGGCGLICLSAARPSVTFPLQAFIRLKCFKIQEQVCKMCCLISYQSKVPLMNNDMYHFKTEWKLAA